MKNRISYLWAKTGAQNGPKWHPLILHMLDVAACVDSVLTREPEATRCRIGAIFGMPWQMAQPWILVLSGAHDIGKASPAFQCKCPELLKETCLKVPRSPNLRINHGFVSQISLAEMLREFAWPEDLSDLLADAVGCHHGERANPMTLFHLEGDRRAIGDQGWCDVRRELLTAMIETLGAAGVAEKNTLSGPEFMLLAGLTSFADWIGSNESWFSYGGVEDCTDLKAWFEKRRGTADRALDAIGWYRRGPLSDRSAAFEDVFSLSPRPLQKTIEQALPNLKAPVLMLVEAPMGEGKTEAALYAFMVLQRRFGHRGLYVALPTKATGNAMFTRVLEFLSRQGERRHLDIQLVHGGALLNDDFQNLRFSGIYDQANGGSIRAGEWFTHKKRALLSEYGVGTVDQALLPILPVRHHFVRLWGLANRVVLLDEIHAYDAYTGTLLVHLLRWLLYLGASVILLSATLPPTIRRILAEAANSKLPENEVEYPRVTCFQAGTAEQIHFMADQTRRREIRLCGVLPDLGSIGSAFEEYMPAAGFGIALLNTVQRAQDLYRLFPEGEPLAVETHRVGKRLSDGTCVYLFHARFPADCRQARENLAIKMFGKGADRSGRKILIATQVAEQSLDLDFDFMITDLAPIDLVLQRAGRLWRHDVGGRPVSEPGLLIAGLIGETAPSFEKPLWWSAVYREDVLLRTWSLLKGRELIVLPDEIDSMVGHVYEECVTVPEPMSKRLEKAIVENDGEAFALKSQAHQAIIGLPDDASWNDSTRLLLYDDDAPGVHRDLIAKTRAGVESALAIPLFESDAFHPAETPGFHLAKKWYLRAVSLSRKSVLRELREMGIPEGWKKSSLLRNCYPLVLKESGFWIQDAMVHFDDDLGVVYEAKEGE